ncbi:MAG TPA: DUF2269 family protein [Actinomycetota bacterium]|nr:DUF2269 family protein [Actinomycetota bacterium]
MREAWKLLHVLVAFWFVAGLIGRAVTLAQVRRESELGRIGSLMRVADRFEKLMVIPGSIAVLLLGLATMVAQDRSLLGEGNRWLLVSLILYVALAALVPTVFLPRGKRYEAALEHARASGTVTPALSEALSDPIVAFARRVELAVVAAIIVLMVTKPF